MAIENNAQNSEIELEITEDTQPEESMTEMISLTLSSDN